MSFTHLYIKLKALHLPTLFFLVTILVLCAPDLLDVIAMSSGMTKFVSKSRNLSTQVCDPDNH